MAQSQIAPKSMAFEDVHGFLPPSAFPMTPPSKMAKPTVKPINSYAVYVSWVSPADFAAQRGARVRVATTDELGNKLVCGFQLRYRTLTDGDLSNHIDVSDTWPPEAHQACLKWLKGGLTYFFEVRAFNGAGNGDWSDAGEPFLMPTAGAISGQCSARSLDELEDIRPVGISSESDSIIIKWKRPCDRGARIVDYDLLCCKDLVFSEGSTKQIRVIGNECKATVRGLEPNTTYFFKYRANNEVGSSPWSPATPGIATKAQPPRRPDPPYQLESSENAGRATEVTIRWEPPESFGIPVQHYSVRTSTHADMKDAVEILMGDREAGQDTETTLGIRSLPSSPARGRPGFNKDSYAMTQLRVKGLNPMTEYYFQVKAHNQIGESAWSAPSSPTRTAASPPSQCGQARFLEGDRRLGFRVCWSRPDSHGLPITHYDVRFSRMVMMSEGVQFFSNPQVKECKVLDASADDMEATLIGKWAAGVEFFCQVRAWNRAGSGSWSLTSEGMMVHPERPLMPQTPSRFTSLPRAVVVHWEDQTCLGAPVSGYRLRYDTTREMRSPVEVIGLQGTRTEFAVTGLAPHHSYHFQLACRNSVGCSEWSPPSRPVQVLQLPPVKMSSPFLVSTSVTSIAVGFTPPVDCGTHDGQLIQSYSVRYSLSRERLQYDVDLFPDEEAAVLDQEDVVHIIRDARPEGTTSSNLKPGRPYFFQVFAVNEFGEGEPSEVVEFSTHSAAPAPPFPPSMVEHTHCSLSLAIHPDDNSGSIITHYTLKVSEVNTQTSWIVEQFDAPGHMLDSEDTLHYTVNKLKPGTSYRIQCAAVNGHGQSAWSNLSQEFTTKPMPPEIVARESVKVSDVQMNSFRLEWMSPIDNGSPITEYTISTCQTGKFEITSSLHKEERCPTTEFVVRGCPPGSTQFVRISAHNALGQGEPSKPVEVTMKIGPPFAVGRPIIRDITSHSVRLLWAVPYDGGDQVKRFFVQWVETDTNGDDKADKDYGEMIVNGLKRQITLPRLQALREYIFKIAAENSVGKGPYSEPTERITTEPPEAPGPPGQPFFISATMTMLTCHWTCAEPNGSPILSQVVRVSTNASMPENNRLDIILSPVGMKPYKPKSKRSPNKNRTLKALAYDNFEARCSAKEVPSAGGHRHDAEGDFISVTASPYASLGKIDLASTTATGASTGASEDGPEWTYKIDPARMDIDLSATLAKSEQPTCIKPVEPPKMPQKNTNLMTALNTIQGMNTEEYEYEVPGLKGGQDYYVTVAARNSVGLGEFSPVSGLMSTLKGPPLIIEKLSFINHCPTSMTLRWDIPDFQGSPITQYQILCAAVDVQDPGVVIDTVVHEYELLPQEIEDPTEPSFCMDALLPGVWYSAMVCSTNSIGTSPWATVVTPERTLPMVPEKMEAPEPVTEERTQASVTFRWNVPAQRGSPLIAIELRHMAASIEECTTDTLDVAELGEQILFEPDPVTGEFVTKHTISGFLPGTMVLLIARGINAVGPGDWSDRPGLIGREKRRDLKRGESAHAIIEGDGRVKEKDLLRVRPRSAPYGPAKEEDVVDEHGCRVRALDLFLKYTTQPTIPSAPEAPFWNASMTTPFSSVFSFKVGKMNGMVYSAFGFRLFAGKPGEDFDMLDEPLGGDGPGLALTGSQMVPVREYQTPVSYEENSQILSKEYLRKRWILELQPGTVYAIQAYTANDLGKSEWSPVGPPMRTPPDRPVMTRAIVSEFTSPSHVELRWGPPYHNGRPILGYDIRYNDKHEFLSLSQWTKIPQDLLDKKWKPHEILEDARTYEVHGLKGGVPHFFIFRARNEVGYSDWSEVSRFVTKPSRPAKIDMPVCEDAKPEDLMIKWQEPDYHGAPITRYECLASMKKTIVAWCRIVGEKLFNTQALDRLLGIDKFMEGELADADGRYEIGHEALGRLDCDEAFYAYVAPTGGTYTYDLSALLPGMNYYFMVRGISDAGKGNWSNIAGPFRTDNLYPAKPTPMKVQLARITTAMFSFVLPYCNGLPIQSARIVLRRRYGPLADHEVHPETGEVHEHVARGEKDFDPHISDTVEVDGLLPGSEYEVYWACINSCGVGFWSDPAMFNTLAGLPDVPGDIILDDC